MPTTAYQDTFAADHLPPRELWPDLINLDQLGYPEQLNCAAELLDHAVAEGDGDRVVIRTPTEAWTYRVVRRVEEHALAGAQAHVLHEHVRDAVGPLEKFKVGPRFRRRAHHHAVAIAFRDGAVK